MTPGLILTVVALYSLLLFFVVWITSRNADNESYFIGNKSSRWYIVAYGMIGASLSGVTFMSVPGAVATTQFSYMQVVFGYMIGYTVIAMILMPVYYSMNLTSIYTYLERRFGNASYKTGSFFFILSRTIGASFRIYIVINVLQTFVFDAWGVPFVVTVATFMVLILLYTYKGGVKTIVWTDTLQTTFMLITVIVSVVMISGQLGIGLTDLLGEVMRSEISKIYVSDVLSPNYFWKNFLGGAFIAIAMTGLDQEMMQKNLSCKNIGEAKKNMFSFAAVLLVVNFLFLILGAVLVFYANQNNLSIDPKHTDNLFPEIALNHLGTFTGLLFIVGLISAAYPSADGALTALTTAFCYDFLRLNKKENLSEESMKRTRIIVHISFAVILLLMIVLFRVINNDAVIRNLFKVAGYTYGPLLGLFAFGFLTKWKIKDKWVPLVCVISPAIAYFIGEYAPQIFAGYKFGFEMIIVNGLITFIGLMMLVRTDKAIK
ncbi:MAG: sodium:solute symporter [Bacteroidetes bacterium]|nr:sodium:solute symporter [Bacteroidota bacterium]